MDGIPSLIRTETASNSSSVAFVHGTSSVVFDSTYIHYTFVMTDIGPATDNVSFQMQVSTDAGSNYTALNVTSTAFSAGHGEDDSGGSLGYSPADDLAESTSAITLVSAAGNDADQSIAGTLHIFNPSSATFSTAFYGRFNSSHTSDHVQDVFPAGYVNSTGDVDAVRFIMSSGNFDGVIQLYGIA